tara:strand:+ start:548 stop:706 length:159 start_codon:yes stop_codon:yes gene_type:complete
LTLPSNGVANTLLVDTDIGSTVQAWDANLDNGVGTSTWQDAIEAIKLQYPKI